MPRAIVRPFMVLLLAGCAGAERGTTAGFTQSDSAGVKIATNTVRVDALKPVFEVDSTPRLRIGVEAGEEALQFNRIRGVVTLDDGRIAVANTNPVAIRIFSPDGDYLTALGSRGQGPGEFQALLSLMPGAGDTLLAVNMPQFQLLRFSVSGGYMNMSVPTREAIAARLAGMRRAEGLHGFFGNGSMFVPARPDTPGPSDGSQYPTGELFRPQSTIIWIAADTGRSSVLGTFGDIEQMFVDIGGGQRDAVIPPSARRQRNALGGRGTRLCVAGNDVPEFRCLDQDGARLVVRWVQDSVATPTDSIDRFRANSRASASRPGSGVDPQIVERVIEGIIIPATLPPVTNIVVADDRRVLVSGPDLIAPPGWQRMRVFSTDGELLGTADLPLLAVHELSGDRLLGVWRNDDGVEFVVVHDVRRE
jgi:hypothetical protein